MRGAQVRGRRRRWVAVTIGAAILLAGALLAALTINGIRWRTQVVAAMATGRIDDVTWGELLRMLFPGAGYNAHELLRDANPFTAIRNPFESEADRTGGREIFVERCSPCHGAEATGSAAAPNLRTAQFKLGDADWALYRSVAGGVDGLTMPPVALSEREAWQVVAYVKELRAETTAGRAHASEPPQVEGFNDVSSARLEGSDSEPENWLTYSGSYRSWRHSALDRIDTTNVAELKLAWSLQVDTEKHALETTPLVVDGIMYLTEPPGNVLAVDAATGERIWYYAANVPLDVPYCCGRLNRGVAVLDDRIFVGTFDAHVVALDAGTGEVEWRAQVADYRDGYSMTGAPLAVADKIIVGIAGGEFGIRGFIDAYDASTGERVWRFHTIPAPGEPGSDTWGNDAWRTGGGPTWVTGSYDPQLRVLYWGVGNPAPDFNGDVRPGDNLYASSVVALDIDSGELAWHFQFTPHDEHDWDANQIPVLVDHEYGGAMRALMLWANRNGFYYVLDRTTGEFLGAQAFVKQTWAEGIDANGRPIRILEALPTRRGTLVWPGVSGGANWWSPSYSPSTDLFYVPFVESPTVFFKGADDREVEPGQTYLGGVTTPTEPFHTGVRALEPTTGVVRWEYLSAPRTGWILVSGVLTTASGVLFFGDEDDFAAFDARDGRELWRVNLGGTVISGPMTYAVAGRQMVAVAAGSALYVFRL